MFFTGCHSVVSFTQNDYCFTLHNDSKHYHCRRIPDVIIDLQDTQQRKHFKLIYNAVSSQQIITFHNKLTYCLQFLLLITSMRCSNTITNNLYLQFVSQGSQLTKYKNTYFRASRNMLSIVINFLSIQETFHN